MINKNTLCLEKNYANIKTIHSYIFKVVEKKWDAETL